jgi:hypothetical protein
MWNMGLQNEIKSRRFDIELRCYILLTLGQDLSAIKSEDASMNFAVGSINGLVRIYDLRFL